MHEHLHDMLFKQTINPQFRFQSKSSHFTLYSPPILNSKCVGGKEVMDVEFNMYIYWK